MRFLVLIFEVLLLLTPSAKAGIVSADQIYISTITGQSNSNGISISSYIYMLSGSSLTFQGAGGYILNTSSITASAFFGDGGNLAQVGVLIATQTFSGADTFTSSFTVQSSGNQIILSTSTSINNISISSAGVISFSPVLHISSLTIIPNGYSTTSRAFGPCVTGSTVTINTTGGRVEVNFVGRIYSGGPQEQFGASFLQDGAYVDELSTTTAITRIDNTTTSVSIQDVMSHFSYLVSPPPAGTHSYCLTIASFEQGGGSATIYLTNDSETTSIFYVKEIK